MQKLVNQRISAQLVNPGATGYSQINGVLKRADESGILVLVDSDSTEHFYPLWRVLNINAE